MIPPNESDKLDSEAETEYLSHSEEHQDEDATPITVYSDVCKRNPE
jgi:hypothetical protein